MKRKFFTTRAGLLCTSLAVLLGGGLAAAPAFAQFHGAGLATQCPKAKAGDSVTCSIRVANQDEYGDTLRIDEIYAVFDAGPGGDMVRVPAAGGLPLPAVLPAGVTCAGAAPNWAYPCEIDGTAQIGGSNIQLIVQATYAIQAGDPDPLPAQGRVSYQDLCDGPASEGCSELPEALSVSASANLFQPSVAVTKDADRSLAKVGDTINYDIELYNTSSADTPALTCTVTDSLLGVVYNGAGPAPGGSQTIGPLQYVVQAGDPASLVNTASVTCSIAGFANTVGDSDSATVQTFTPAIDVTKTADKMYSKIGDTVNYTITLWNNSSANTPALDCSADDSLSGNVFNGVLPAGSTVINVPRQVQAGDPDPLVNTVTLNCSIAGFPNTLSDSASASVDLFAPAIDVTKTADKMSSKIGDTVTYTITLWNNSSAGTPALDCSADDSLSGNVFNGVLPAGSTVINVPRQVQAGDPDPLVNTVTLNCSVAGFPNTLSDSASATVDLFGPAISVSKSADKMYAKVGDTVNYTITASNNSSPGTPALSCTLSDSLLGALTIPDPLPPGDTVVYASRDVQGGDPDPLVNTVTLDCDVAGFPNTLSDSDSATVDLVYPAVDLSKQCSPPTLVAGETIYWDITVDNLGDVGLNCIVNDATAGIVNEAVNLAPGGSATISASRATVPEDEGTISNTADVSCTLATTALPNVLTDQATADCEVTLPVFDEAICRTPGFWGTHAGTEKKNSTDLAQLVIDYAGGSISVCGKSLTNTDVGNMFSTTEAICVSPRGDQRLQLARHLTAMALNCVISGAGADCSGLDVGGLFADADAACASDSPYLGDYIGPVDCFNNGGHWMDGMCVYDENNCHERYLSDSEVFAGVSPLPGPAGSSNACNAANKNTIYILP